MPYLTQAFAPSGWRHWLWLSLLVAASLAFTFGFACAVPFAAFGAVAALTLTRRDALLVTVALWLVNQVIGFTMMGYPWDAMTLAWGAILGVVAMISTACALGVTERGIGGMALAATGFAASFAVYEGALYLVSATVMGGTEAFAPAIVLRILAINAAGFAALLAGGFLIAAAGSRDRSIGLIAPTSAVR